MQLRTSASRGEFGSLSGTTAVTIIPETETGFNVLMSIRLNNTDTVSHDFTVSVLELGVSDVLAYPTITLQASEFFYDDYGVVLSPGQSMTVSTDATATTTEPTFAVAWNEVG